MQAGLQRLGILAGRGHVFPGAIGRGQASPEIQVDRPRKTEPKRRHEVHRCRRDPGEESGIPNLAARVDVDPGQAPPASARDPARDGRRHPEMRARPHGSYLLVGLRGQIDVQSQEQVRTMVGAGRGRGFPQVIDLVRMVDDDPPHAVRDGSFQLGSRLRVPV